MRRRAAVSLGLTALILVGVPACGGDRRPAASSSAIASVPMLVPADTAAGSVADRAIGTAQAELRTSPGNPRAMLDLAQAYLQKAREAADPTLYSKSGQLLALVARAEPGDPELLETQGSLDNSLHKFTAALAAGRQAVARNPAGEAGYAVVVDASNELGRYDSALDATEHMADLRSDLPALARVSYARELRGDLDGAIAAMAQAVTAGGSDGGENVAYVTTLLGDLLLTRGDVSGASAAYESALVAFAGFGPAQAGRAKVLVAEGRPADAAQILAGLVKVIPLAEYAIAEGDDWAAAGEPTKAADAYGLVGVIEQLYAANGVNVDLELALFDADHHPGRAAVAKARQGLKARSSYYGHEVLAWTLFRTGQIGPAVTEIRAALALGDRDPLLRYHAAAIFDAAGHRSEAAASLAMVLQGNPRFSALHAPDVARLALRYGMTVPPVAPGGSGR